MSKAQEMSTGTALIIAICIFGGAVGMAAGVDELCGEGSGAAIFGCLLLLIGLLMCCTRKEI